MLKLLKTIYISIIALLISINPVLANSTGTYTSARIGEEAISRFLTFRVLEQSTPDGTAITYSFAGSKDNYLTWSAAQTTTDFIDLSSISNLAGSKYLKVKINMSSNSANVPSVKGFEVTYETTSSSTSSSGTSSSSSSSGSSSSSSGSGSSSGSSSSSSSSGTSSGTSQSSSNNVKTQTVTLSQNQKKNLLVSTGSNLWVNLGAALIITSLVSFFIFRKRYNDTVDKV